MRNKMQMSLFDIYNDVSEAVKKKKPKVIALLEEHINFEKIPDGSALTRFKQKHFLFRFSLFRNTRLSFFNIPDDAFYRPNHSYTGGDRKYKFG